MADNPYFNKQRGYKREAIKKSLMGKLKKKFGKLEYDK